MKILALSEHYPPLRGGTVRYVTSICQELGRRGHEVTLVTVAEAGGVAARACSNEYRVLGVGVPRRLQESRIGRVVLRAKVSRHIEGIVDRLRPDVVHIMYGHTIPGSVHGLFGRLPIIWTIHNVPPHEYGLPSYKPRTLKRVAQRLYVDLVTRIHRRRLTAFNYNKLVCVSEVTRRRAIAAGVAPSKTVVIPLAVDIEVFKPVPDALRAEIRTDLGWKDRRVVLSVAGVARHKCQDVILRALPSVLKKVPRAAYVNVGPVRDDEYRKELRYMCKELKIESSVQLVELSDSELVRYYAAADGCVQPSIDEGFGLAPLEGLSSGNWVVARDVGGIGQYIRESGGGEIVDGSPASFEEAISRVIGTERSREERARLHRYVAEKYSWQRVGRDTEELYAECV